MFIVFCKFPAKSKYSYARADLSITAKIITEWDGLVLRTVDRAELVQKWVPKQFATTTFFHTLSGLDRYASTKRALENFVERTQTVDCICTFVLIIKIYVHVSPFSIN